MQSGDEALARSLLAPDVLIYESGGYESSLQEYAAHHLKADLQFMAKIRVQTLDQKSEVVGDLAWVSTRARFTGTDTAKPLTLLSTETMVLRRNEGQWRIRHVHWSSAEKR
jgi:ketosteroid isomerase-like protein